MQTHFLCKLASDLLDKFTGPWSLVLPVQLVSHEQSTVFLTQVSALFYLKCFCNGFEACLRVEKMCFGLQNWMEQTAIMRLQNSSHKAVEFGASFFKSSHHIYF